ncbi:MAG TPA: hypothetical protein VN363_06755 [Anaerolineales bacterium]|nr:hypothetical protein [Anaerolineales bacterium]
MKPVRLGWLLPVIWVAILISGCQTPSIEEAAIPSPEPSPTVEFTITPTPPAATALPVLVAATQPSPAPTPQPVYTAITSQNAARLALLKAIEFGPWSQITSLEWAPDGKYLAVSAGNQVFLLDPISWENMDRVDVGASSPGLAASPDSRYLAAASRDGRLTVWEIGGTSSLRFSMVYTLEVHRKGANQAAFSPSGEWLASGGNDALARVRRLEDGEELAQIIGGSYAVADLAFSPDGEWLAIANSSLIRLRRPDSGVMGLTLQAEQPLFCLEFSPDGRWLAAGDSANQVLLWELQRDAAVQVVGEHSGQPGTVEALVWQIDFNPEGNLLASAGGDGAVQIWELTAGESLAELGGHIGAATSARFSPDGLWLATGDLGGNLRIWGVAE